VPDDVQLNQVRAFVTLFRTGSYARAAEDLAYSEPAIFVQLKRLEATLGVPLVRRHRKQLVFTPEGLQLIESANELLAGANAFTQLARNLRGRIVVAAGESTATTWLMPVLAAYEAAEPHGSVEFHTPEPTEIIRGVLDGNYDVGMAGGLRQYILPDHLKHRDFRLVPWATGSWAFYGPAQDAPQRSRQRIFVSRFSTFALTPERLAHIAAPGVELDLVEVDTLNLVRGAVANGLGFGALPTSSVSITDRERFRFVAPIPDSATVIYLFHRRPRLLAAPVRAFLRHLVRSRPRNRHAALPGGTPAPAQGGVP
jgi:DNA-binding transcriptional LysR family regulator